MRYLEDTNLLLRGAEPAHPMYPVAVHAIATLLDRGDEVVLVPQNLFEFWVVVTRPRDRNGLGMTVAQAEAELSRLEIQLPLLPDSPSLYQEWRRLVTTYGVRGARAHDARLVAAMLTHGITHILTFNVDDFRQFREITVVHPQDVR
jgi:predicted nucleic acid-binding protein